MFIERYVFSQVMDFIPRYQFEACVKRYRGDRHLRQFSCRDQFLCMAFGQLSYRDSLRDTIICLRTQRNTLYHLGISSSVSRSTLARVNEKRDWRIYRDFAEIFIMRARKLCIDDREFRLNLEGSVYALDSSTIDLCLGIFRWAEFRTTKSGIKLHTMFDIRSNIPSFFLITKAKVSDVRILDQIPFESGAHYVFDRGYLDFRRLFRIDCEGAFFLIRAKRNTKLKTISYRRVSKKWKESGVESDHLVSPIGTKTKASYPKPFRRVVYHDSVQQKRFVFLTNDLKADPKTIADLYRYRWRIELFFKWIKQHLKIKSFWGRSRNAVKTQICIAISTYLLVAILRKELKLDRSLYEILQILSVSLFVKKPLNTLFSEDSDARISKGNEKQTCLWDF